MPSIRLSRLLEVEGRLPVDEAAALAFRLLSDVRPRVEPRLVTPVGVLLGGDGRVGVLSPGNQRAFLRTESAPMRRLCGAAERWLPPGESGSDSERFGFGVAAVLATCLTGERPFQEPLTEDMAGRPVFDGLMTGLVRAEVPERLAWLVCEELCWPLQPPRGSRTWPQRPMEREAVKATLLGFVGDGGPTEALEVLGLRVQTKVAEGRPGTATRGARADREAARLVLADDYEQRGQVDEAEWLRLESESREAPTERLVAILERLGDLRARLSPRFLAEVSRPAIEGCPVRFGFECPRQWEELEPTGRAEQRYCSVCDSQVHFVVTVEAARQAAREGRCIAIAPSVETNRRELDQMVMGMPLVAEFDDAPELDDPLDG